MTSGRSADPRRAGVWILALLLVLAPRTARSHEGHDHAAPEPVSSDPNLVVRSASNEDYEVVLKYRSVAGERSTTARIYLSDFATDAPIERAGIGLRTTAPRQVAASGQAVSPGVYEATLPYEQPGRYTLILTLGTTPVVEFAFPDLPMGENLAPEPVSARTPRGLPGWPLAGAAVILLTLFVLLIRRRSLRPASRTALILLVSVAGSVLLGRSSMAREGNDQPSEPAARSSQPPSQTHYMPKESQFLFGVRTLPGRLESLHQRINAVGHVVPESGALASVAAPQSGKTERVGPLAVGDRVREGQVIANLLVIDRLPIRAPISGLVAEVHFSPGQWVQAGEPLVVILDERRVRVELPLFGEDLSRALRARKGTVTTSALPGTEFAATVRGLAPTASEPAEATGGATGGPIPPLLLAVNNRGGLLRPGMLVEASLELAATERLVAVPESAVIRQEYGTVVFVHTAPEVFEQRLVRVVGRYGNRVGLAGDVRPGDRIVVAGAQALVSAPPVMTVAPPKPVQAKR